MHGFVVGSAGVAVVHEGVLRAVAARAVSLVADWNSDAPDSGITGLMGGGEVTLYRPRPRHAVDWWRIRTQRKGERMTATTIHFVRHGEVHNPDHVLYERLPGFHLSDRGVRMARATARYLASNPQTSDIRAVYSSPLERTRQTADEILRAVNARRSSAGQEPLSMRLDERVIEAGNEFRGMRIGHGQGALWRPRNLRLVRNLWTPTWGESYRHIASRMADFSRDVIRRHPDEQVVVVSHESPIWSFRHYLETGHPEHNMLLRHAALASVTSITIDDETGGVMSITYVDPAAHIR